MAFVYYIIGAILLFFFRQVAVHSLGSSADIVVVGIPCLLWLWQPNSKKWFLLIVPGLMIDLLIPRVLPFYSLANIASLSLLYLLILPYFSNTTTLTKLTIFFIWLLVWRFFYIAWLALGWFVGGAPINLELPLFWQLLNWLIFGLLIAVISLGAKITSEFLKKRHLTFYG